MPIRPDAGGWDTGLLAKGETASVTFNQPGTYTYNCTPHPSMIGQIIVTGQAVASAPATVVETAAPKPSDPGSASSANRPAAGSWRALARQYLMRFAVIAAAMLVGSSATAADRIRVAVQRTGTLAWELDIIKAHGLDKKAGLQIETIELAGTEAGKIALKGGSADLMLSDWLWVARERSLGDSWCSIRHRARSAP